MELIAPGDVIGMYVEWSESFELYGENRGTFTNYGDDRPLGTYDDVVVFAECQICGECTKLSPSCQDAVDRHFDHCARVHDYAYSHDKRLKVHDRDLQDFIRLSQEYDLPIPHLSDHDDCIKQYIKLHDGSQKVGCGIHKGNEAKVWMGIY